jgi:c-di-GMP-binding flagellar brake protein YcgR
MDRRRYFRVQANLRVTFGRPEDLGYIFEMRELIQALRHEADFAKGSDPMVLRLVDALTILTREVEFLHRRIVGNENHLFRVEAAELSEGGLRLRLPTEHNVEETWMTLSFELHGRPQIVPVHAVRQWQHPVSSEQLDVGYAFDVLDDEQRAKVVALVFQEECRGRRTARAANAANGEE